MLVAREKPVSFVGVLKLGNAVRTKPDGRGAKRFAVPNEYQIRAASDAATFALNFHATGYDRKRPSKKGRNASLSQAQIGDVVEMAVPQVSHTLRRAGSNPSEPLVSWMEAWELRWR